MTIAAAWMPRSLTCGLFSMWHSVWSPDGPQNSMVLRLTLKFKRLVGWDIQVGSCRKTVGTAGFEPATP